MLNTKDEQDIYLQGLIEKHDVRRRCKPKTKVRHTERTCSFNHYVLVKETRTKVCQNAFLSLHAISVKRLKRIKTLLQQKLTPRDKRGHNPKTHALRRNYYFNKTTY